MNFSRHSAPNARVLPAGGNEPSGGLPKFRSGPLPDPPPENPISRPKAPSPARAKPDPPIAPSTVPRGGPRLQRPGFRLPDIKKTGLRNNADRPRAFVTVISTGCQKNSCALTVRQRDETINRISAFVRARRALATTRSRSDSVRAENPCIACLFFANSITKPVGRSCCMRRDSSENTSAGIGNRPHSVRPVSVSRSYCVPLLPDYAKTKK